MSEMTSPNLNDVWGDIGGQIQLLAVSGVAGAFFRAAMAPEKEWKRRVIQGVAGAASAIFLGGLLGHFVEGATAAGPYAYLASGFIMGSGGELAVKAIQDRFLKGRE